MKEEVLDFEDYLKLLGDAGKVMKEFKQFKSLYDFLENRDGDVELAKFFEYLFTWEETDGSAFLAVDSKALYSEMCKTTTSKIITLPILADSLLEHLHPTVQ